MAESVAQRDDLDHALDVVRDYLRHELGDAAADRFFVWAPLFAQGARNCETWDWKSSRRRARFLYDHRHQIYPELADKLPKPRAGVMPDAPSRFARSILQMAHDLSVPVHVGARQLLALAMLTGIEDVPCADWSSNKRDSWSDAVLKKWQKLREQNRPRANDR